VGGSRQLDLDGERFVILAALEGEVTIGSPGGEVDLPAGTSALLPAALGPTTLSAPEGARLLALSVPRTDEVAAAEGTLRGF
jgi:mannose-6-phosphate isomerase class I